MSRIPNFADVAFEKAGVAQPAGSLEADLGPRLLGNPTHQAGIADPLQEDRRDVPGFDLANDSGDVARAGTGEARTASRQDRVSRDVGRRYRAPRWRRAAARTRDRRA